MDLNLTERFGTFCDRGPKGNLVHCWQSMPPVNGVSWGPDANPPYVRALALVVVEICISTAALKSTLPEVPVLEVKFKVFDYMHLRTYALSLSLSLSFSFSFFLSITSLSHIPTPTHKIWPVYSNGHVHGTQRGPVQLLGKRKQLEHGHDRHVCAARGSSRENRLCTTARCVCAHVL